MANMSAEFAIAQTYIFLSAQNFQGSLLCHYSDSIQKICGCVIDSFKKILF